MLSSLLQQKGDDLPNIIVNISHVQEEDGDPTTTAVCKFFKEKGLNIKETIVPFKMAGNRGFARNIQVKETTSDYMLFVDSDMVYDPYFFDDLHKQIKSKLWQVKVVMGADRHSLNDKFCIEYFQNDQTKYPTEILNVADVVAKWPVKWVAGRLVVPGFFQLAKTSIIKEKGNTYAGRKSRDNWRGTYSDRTFRRIMGGRTPIIVKKMYHLNHDRKGSDIQR